MFTKLLLAYMTEFIIEAMGFFLLVVASNSDKKGANVCFIVFSLFKT